MKAAAKSPAPAPARSNAHGLTLPQQNAVDLLAAGKNDTEAADALGLNRVTVTRWRLDSPEFRAALADRRAAVWGAAADRLRALLPQALDTLAEALTNPERPDRVAVALAVLKLAGPLPLVPAEPTDPDEFVRRVVDAERAQLRDRDDALDELDGLPDYDTHAKTVRKRLARLSVPNDGSEGRPTDLPPGGRPRSPQPTGAAGVATRRRPGLRPGACARRPRGPGPPARGTPHVRPRPRWEPGRNPVHSLFQCLDVLAVALNRFRQCSFRLPARRDGVPADPDAGAAYQDGANRLRADLNAVRDAVCRLGEWDTPARFAERLADEAVAAFTRRRATDDDTRRAVAGAAQWVGDMLTPWLGAVRP